MELKVFARAFRLAQLEVAEHCLSAPAILVLVLYKQGSNTLPSLIVQVFSSWKWRNSSDFEKSTLGQEGSFESIDFIATVEKW